MTAPFGERLADAVAARGPLCVGIDPHAPLLEKWGLPDSPAGLARFTDAFEAGDIDVEFVERHLAEMQPQDMRLTPAAAAAP